MRALFYYTYTVYYTFQVDGNANMFASDLGYTYLISQYNNILCRYD